MSAQMSRVESQLQRVLSRIDGLTGSEAPRAPQMSTGVIVCVSFIVILVVSVVIGAICYTCRDSLPAVDMARYLGLTGNKTAKKSAAATSTAANNKKKARLIAANKKKKARLAAAKKAKVVKKNRLTAGRAVQGVNQDNGLPTAPLHKKKKKVSFASLQAADLKTGKSKNTMGPGRAALHTKDDIVKGVRLSQGAAVLSGIELGSRNKTRVSHVDVNLGIRTHPQTLAMARQQARLKREGDLGIPVGASVSQAWIDAKEMMQKAVDEEAALKAAQGAAVMSAAPAPAATSLLQRRVGAPRGYALKAR